MDMAEISNRRRTAAVFARWLAAVALYCFAIGFVQPCSAGVPVKINYQGNLRQHGFLVNGSRNMVFRIYDSSTAAAALWTSPTFSVSVSTGVFRVTLEPSLNDWETGNLWLELEIDGVRLSPREEMTSAPYAVNSLMISGKRYLTSGAAPSSPASGDLWMDTSANVLKFWNGSSWIQAGVSGTSLHAAEHSGTGGDPITILGTHTVTGYMTVSSAVTAGWFYGDGSGLTGLNAARISTGQFSGDRIAAGVMVSTHIADKSIARQKLAQSGCADGQVLKWDNTAGYWACAVDIGAGSEVDPYSVHIQDTLQSGATFYVSSGTVGSFYVTGALEVYAPARIIRGAGEAGNVLVISTGTSDMVRMTGDGSIYANRFYGDISGATGLPGGDNLGNHTATQDLTMGSYRISGSGAVTASSYTATGIGVSAAQLRLADNVLVSSEAQAGLGGGVRVSSNVYVVGFASATKYYGDGSALTGLSGADNLGNHTATQNLNMAWKDIISVSTISVSSIAIAGTGPGVAVSTHLYVNGKIYGDISGATGLPAGDNLGSHNATTRLNMGGNQILGVSSLTVIAPTVLSSSLWVSTSAATPQLYVSTTGNVGIGTSAPGSTLEVNAFDIDAGLDVVNGLSTISHYPYIGVDNYAGSTLGHPFIRVRNAGGTKSSPGATALGATLGGVIAYGHNASAWVESGRLEFYTENDFVTNNAAGFRLFLGDGLGGESIRLTATSTGNIGIGTATPAYRLVVSSGAGEAGTIVAISTGSSNVIRMTGDGSIYANRFYGDISGATGLPGGDNLGNHTATTALNMGGFDIVNASSIAVAAGKAGLTISTNAYLTGNVVVGTITPRVPLHVVGSGAGPMPDLSAYTPLMLLQHNLNDGYYAMMDIISGTDGKSMIQFGDADDHRRGGLVYKNSVNNLNDYFGIWAGGGAEKFVITSAGNTGVGNTNPSYKLHISSGAGEAGTIVVISTGSSNVIRMTGDGSIYANRFYGDISGATGLPGGDNLGNHTATTALNMGGFGIANAGAVMASSYTATGIGVSAAQLRLGDNVLVSSEAQAGLGGGVRVSSNVYVVGFASATKYYGDGSALTGLAGADNLGNHTAVQNLNMAWKDIVSVSTISVSSIAIAGSGPGVAVSTHLYVNGRIYGDISGATGLPGGDNLGNHTAVTALNMAGFGIANASTSTYTGFINVTSTAGYAINGFSVLRSSDAPRNLFVGREAGKANSGAHNTFVGHSAGYNNAGNEPWASYNTFLGDFAGYSNSAGYGNSFVGADAGVSNSAGGMNTFVGYQSGYSNTANENTMVGGYSGRQNTTGKYNSLLGVESSRYNASGSSNTVIGYQAGYGVNANSYEGNAILGYQAGYKLATGSRNVFLGSLAGYYMETGSDNIVIGYNQNAPSTASSGRLNIGGLVYGDLSSKTIGINRNSQMSALDVVSTGTTTNHMAQIWRASDDVIKASMSATGVMMATKFIGDGSGLSGVSGAGDNLGNHNATQRLNMGNYAIWSSSSVTAANYQINGSTVLSLTGGAESIAVGVDAGSTSTGGYNVFVGKSAGAANSTGNSNSYVGWGAGKNSTTGTLNSFFGSTSGLANTTGGSNSFFGYYSGRNNTIGSENVFLGLSAGYVNTEGIRNTFVGAGAGKGNTTGSNNVVVGYEQAASAPGASNELNIGGVLFGDLSAKTIGISTRAPQAALDVVSTGTLANQYAQIWRNSAGTIVASMTATGVLYPQTVGSGDNLGNHNATQRLNMGSYAIWSSSDITATKYQIGGNTVLAVLPGQSSIGVGAGAGAANTGNYNSFFGSGAGLANNSGANNSFVGYYAGASNTTGGGNTFVGEQAGYLNDIGQQNSFFGVLSGQANTGGTANAFMGAYSGYMNTLGNFNSFFGPYSAYSNTSGASNSVMGYNAAYNTKTGLNNAVFGAEAGYGVANNSFSNSVVLGYRAGYGLMTGSDNVLIGYQAGDNLTSGARNIIVGYDQDTSAPGASNELNIGGVLFGNLSAKTIGISTRVPQAALDVVSTGTLANQYAQIWRNSAGTIVASMTATGVLYPQTVGSGDNFGNHTAVQDLLIGGNDIYNASTITASGNITAARYQISGSTVLALLPGTGSLGVGLNAGRVSRGDYNSFIGYLSGNNNTTGAANSFIGYGAGSVNTTGNANSFVGFNAGGTNTTGFGNSFYGHQAGVSQDAGYENSFVGFNAGYSHTSGYDNVYMGSETGYWNLAGIKNLFLGADAGYYNQNGSANVILGAEAGLGASGNSFSSSTLVGYRSGRYLTTGSDNIFIGWQAGFDSASGGRNIIIGYDQRVSDPAASNELNIGGVLFGNLIAKTIGISTRAPQAALDVVSTGTLANQYAQIWRNSAGTIVASMTATGVLYPQTVGSGDNLGDHNAAQRLNMGNYAVWSSSDITAVKYQINGNTVLSLPTAESIAVGPYSGAAGNNSVFVGKYAGTNNSGTDASFLGYQAGYSNSGNENTFVGAMSGRNNTTAYNNSFFGSYSGNANTTGLANSFIGYSSGRSNIGGNKNSFLGAMAGFGNTEGLENSFAGSEAGYSNITGSYNSFFGVYSGYNNTASNNTFIGHNSGYENTSGKENSYLGYQSGLYNRTGAGNAAFGAGAGRGLVNNSFSSSTLVGYHAGYFLSTGSDNILLGFQAGDGLQTGSRNIIIGYDQDAPASNTSNHLNIGGAIYGDLSTGNVGIGAVSPGAKLEVAGQIKITGGTPGAGKVLTSDAAGLATWTTPASGADNLGSHIATTMLNMAGFGITNVSTSTYTGYINVLSTAGYAMEGVTILRASDALYGTFVGREAGRVNTGLSNAFIGYRAGFSNTTGNYNSFLGYHAGLNNTTGLHNSFLGYQAGYLNTIGEYNAFLGSQAGYSNTSGWYNSFIGAAAGANNTTGEANSFLGYAAGGSNTTGAYNSLMGYYAGYYTQSGSSNTISGYRAGYGASGNSYAGNSLYGYQAGFALTTGSSNTFVGSGAGGNATSGGRNIVIGYNANVPSATGSDQLNIGNALYGNLSAKTMGVNRAVQEAALDIVSTGTAADQMAQIWRDNTGVVRSSMSATGVMMATKFIGDGSGLSGVSGAGDNLGNHNATQRLNMGNYAIWSSSSVTAANYQINGSTVLAVLPGTDSIAVGEGAGIVNSGDYNIFVGPDSGRANTTGYRNAFLGALAGRFNTTGYGNSFVGAYAGYANTTGVGNSFIGYAAGNDNTSGINNSFFGYLAGQQNTTGGDNTFIGRSAGLSNTTGGRNAYLGTYAGYNSNGTDNTFAGWYAGTNNGTGSSNTMLGSKAGYYTQTGSANAVFGTEAGYGVTGNSFSSATLMGYRAGYGLTTGSDNILLGFQAGDSLTTGTRNIIIGYDKDAPAATTSNHLNIGDAIYGDLSTGNVGIGAVSPGAKLEVAGQIKITGGTPGAGKVLTSDAAGLAIWTTPASGADNLGDHNATQRLNMGNYAIWSSSSVTAANYQINGSTVLAVLQGTDSIAYGIHAGASNLSGDFNVLIGNYAGQGNTTGDSNSFFGYQAGKSNSTGFDNTFMGRQAGYTNTKGIWNSFVGAAAGSSNTTGASNTFLGYGAGYFNETGAANTIIGKSAGNGWSGNSFSSATLMGYHAGYGLTTGSDNILLGFQAGDSLTTGTRNIIIGYDLDASAASASNELNIGGIYKGNIAGGTATIPKVTVQAADAGITVTAADFGKTITVNSASAQIVTLPSVSAADIGATITVIKLGAGTVTIDAPAGAYIADSGSGGTVYNNVAAETYATITLRLATSTMWSILCGNGSWTTTN